MDSKQKDMLLRLQALLPEAFTSGKLDLHKLQELAGEEGVIAPEHYGLNWQGKEAAYRQVQSPAACALVPDKDSSIVANEMNHLFIEGDNLEVLKLLQQAYQEKVRLICIDPPYNTGSGSFVYNDNFYQGKNVYRKKAKNGHAVADSGRYHSRWLSMMLPRLVLARTLLAHDGAIIVHIDEHEQANLTLLLNEVFGEDNNIGHIVWDKGNPKGDAGGIAYQHESILVYAKDKEAFLQTTDLVRKKKNAEKILKKAAELYQQLGREVIPADIRQLHKAYHLPNVVLQQCRYTCTLTDINTRFRAWLKTADLSGGEQAYNKIDEAGDVYRLVSMAWPNKKTPPPDYFVPLVHPLTRKPCPVPRRGWRYPTATMKRLLQEGQIIFGADDTVQPQRKYRLKENMFENLPSVLCYAGSDDDLMHRMGLEFQNPKPVAFVKSLVQAFTRPVAHDIVLDFFAGSGSTAHAVLEANTEDGGNRSFICVQLPEPLGEKSAMWTRGLRTIADITRARIRAVLEAMNAGGRGKPTVGVQCFCLAPCSEEKEQEGEAATTGILGQVQ